MKKYPKILPWFERIKKHKITVFDYRNCITEDKTDNIKEYKNVEAWCVGGDEGIMAFFLHPTNPDRFIIAGGDDGHWWVEHETDIYWLSQISTTMSVFNAEVEHHKIDMLNNENLCLRKNIEKGIQ